MDRRYDSAQMQRVSNALEQAISEANEAVSKLGTIDLSRLKGKTQQAMQSQIEKRRQTLTAQVRQLQVELERVKDKMNGLA